MQEPIATTDLGGVTHDFSVYGMFQQADWVVKSVMIMLVLASIWAWAIIVHKAIAYRQVRRRADSFEDQFWNDSLEELYAQLDKVNDHPLALIFTSAMREWQHSIKKAHLDRDAIAGRIMTIMRVTREREMTRLEQRLGFLASVGSVAPFVGLFGTVWGIMNSFQSIAISRNTSLAVVAPGIAEALFATALGLLAAIPAVIAYNIFTSQVNDENARMYRFKEHFNVIFSRGLLRK